MPVAVNRSNQTTNGVDDSLSSIEKLPLCIMETQPLAKQDNFDRQVNKVSECLGPSPPKHNDVELKELPEHFEYVFLEEEHKRLVIISSTLEASQKERLVSMLREHKKPIAWSISDIKAINLSFCAHKILIEDNIKPRV